MSIVLFLTTFPLLPNMKKSLFLTTFLLIHSFSFSQSVPVQIVNDTLKACSTNIATATFAGTGQHKLTIDGSLIFGANSHLTCGGGGVLIEFLSLKDNLGNSISHTPPLTDTANGSVYLSFNTTDSCVLTYKIHIDCSAIPTGANVDPIFALQTWTDSISTINYNLNASGVDTLQSAAILYPKLVYIPTVIDTIGYQETKILQFTFLNTGFTTANISFRFLEDATNYCGAFVNVDSLFYKINHGGSPFSYTNGDQAFIQLPVSDTLFIYRSIRAINCLDTCTHQSIFTWQCANRDSLGTAFCPSCFGSNTINYTIANRIIPQLKVIRAVPVSDQVTNFDVSCPNSLTDMRQWEYFITTDDIGKLDSAVIHFTNYHPDSISSLGLIPESTLQIDTLCSSCNFQMTYGQRDFALCADSVTNPIDNLKMVITDFGDGDTIKFRFQSFRCVEEDTLLYNVPKSYTNWTFRNTYSVSKCGLKDTIDFLYPNYVANGIVGDVAAVADLSLIYTPTVSDLSSPPNNFGDSADFEIKMNGLFIDQYNSIKQLLGCDPSSANCIPTGYFKVTIECDPGLIVPNAQHYTCIKYKDSLGFINYYQPEYFYQDTSILGQCAAGSYVFYFNLNDSNALRMIKGGFFQFRLRSCCGGQNGAVKYKVLYDWLLNPSGSCNSLTFPAGNVDPAICTGTNCKWLPLSFVEDDIVVHCPGCVTPGIVVRSYRMERTSYGNKDSNDNGFADSPLTPIEYNSPSFLANRNNYGWYNSGIGDQLTDYLVAEFGAGDSGAGGYTYPMMTAQHSYLNHLQLDRIISAGLDTMKVLPDTVLLYIDTPVSGAPDSCIDCGVFNVDSTKFVTQRVLKFFGSSLSKILFLDAVNNRFFFSFSSVDSSGHTGVLNGSDIIYNNTTYPYLGFFERQQYRLSVDYNVTGNFNLPRNYSGAVALDLIRKQSDIENRMWLSGDSLPSFAWNQFYKNPTDTSELNTAGWYFPPGSSNGDTAVNQNFANRYMFNCENLDGIHYFYSHIYDVKSEAGYVDDCIFKIQTSIFTNVAARILDPYPFEYHPSNIQPRSYTFTIPTGYKTVGALLTNEIYSGGVTFRNLTTSLTIDTNPTFIYYDSLFQINPCFEEGDTTTGTKLYFGDIQTFRSIEILVESNNCDTSGFKIDSTTAVVSFEGDVDHCVDVNAVTFDFVDTLKSLQGTILYNIRPNDKVSFTPSFDVQSNRICFTFSIENPFVTFGIDTFSTFAPNYFVVIPDTNTINWLSNWTYHSSNGISYPINNQFFLSDTLLTINETHIGDSICASFSYCPDSSSQTVKFYSGWSCSDSLLQPFDTTALCQFDSITFIIDLKSTNLGLSDGGARNRPLSEVYYTLCDTLFYECCFKSTQNGEVTLNNIELPNFPDSLGVLDVSIRKGYCDSLSLSPWLSIVYDTLLNNWPITATDMDSIGYIDSVLKINEGISIRIAYMPDCHFQDTLPDVVLNAQSYCGESLSSTYDFNNTLTRDTTTSACHDCFTLTKIASDSIIAALDTMSFTIEICATNQDSGFVYLFEYLPPYFVPISTIPLNVITPSIGCTTLVVYGYFTQSGDCIANENLVQIKYAGFDSLNVYWGTDSLLDSVCVTVTNACIDGTEIIMQNGGFASSGNFQSIYSGAKFYVEGTFTIDMDITFNQCEIIAAPGAQIIIQSGYSLTIDSLTTISGCDSMWNRILMQEESRFFMFNNSTIADANAGLEMADYCNVQIDKSSIVNCVKSVLLPPHPSSGTYSLQEFSITSSRFGLFNTFKPDYSGQPLHGNKPNIGIELNDLVASIGSLSSDSNWIYNCNIGLLGFRAHLTIQNTYFSQIKKDVFYQNHIGGTAQVILGDSSQRIASSLDVNPLASQSFGVQYSDRAVYSEYASLEVAGCKMNNLVRGIEASQCPTMKKTMIVSNEIYANQYGVYLHDNLGAKLMYVADNKIIVHGDRNSIAVFLDESTSKNTSNYKIEYNTDIRIIDGSQGILARNLGVADISCNTINQIGAGVPPPLSNGIQLSGCNKVLVKSNNIYSTYSNTLGITRGVAVDVSTNSTVTCNYLFNQYYGVYFGGICGGTDFRGNTMHLNFEGLHLNSNAEIGLQINTGNEFIGNFDTTSLANFNGAYNENNGFSGLQASRIDVHVNMGTQNSPNEFYFPKIPISNFSFNTPVGAPYFSNGTSPSQTDWFVRIAGTPFLCPDYCISNITSNIVNNNDFTYEELIAMDSTQTVDFDPESRSMSNQYLYEKLQENDSLLQSDTLYLTFAASHASTCIGRLHEVGQLVSTAIYDSVYSSFMLQVDSIINIKLDSIELLDSLTFVDHLTDYSMQRESLLSSFEFYSQLFSTLENQKQVLVSNFNIQARAINSVITPQETPELNQVLVNEALLDLEVNGAITVSLHSANMFAVAQQCPYSGGAAVYQARWYVKKYINDSIDYDDKTTCLTQGIYRITSNASPSTSIENFDFSIAPNPNNGVFELKFSSEIKSTAKIEILNSFHQVVDVMNLPIGSNFYSIELEKLKAGVYFAQFSQLPHIRITKKMVLIK